MTAEQKKAKSILKAIVRNVENMTLNCDGAVYDAVCAALECIDTDAEHAAEILNVIELKVFLMEHDADSDVYSGICDAIDLLEPIDEDDDEDEDDDADDCDEDDDATTATIISKNNGVARYAIAPLMIDGDIYDQLIIVEHVDEFDGEQISSWRTAAYANCDGNEVMTWNFIADATDDAVLAAHRIKCRKSVGDKLTNREVFAGLGALLMA